MHPWRRNCFGFLRITASSEDADVEALDALDATRVSPTQYQLAKELARAILDAGGSYNAEDDIVLQAQARPNDVEGFNLQVSLLDQIRQHCVRQARF